LPRSIDPEPSPFALIIFYGIRRDVTPNLQRQQAVLLICPPP